MPKFRFHRGSLLESMKTCIEVNDRQELYNEIRKKQSMIGYNFPGIETLVIEKYGERIDRRTEWDTHIVKLDGVPIGFTDSDLKK